MKVNWLSPLVFRHYWIGFGLTVFLVLSLGLGIVNNIPTIVGGFITTINRSWNAISTLLWWYADWLGWAINAGRGIKSEPWGSIWTVILMFCPLMIGVFTLMGIIRLARWVFRLLRAIAMIPVSRIFFEAWPWYFPILKPWHWELRKNSDLRSNKRKYFIGRLEAYAKSAFVLFDEQEKMRTRIGPVNYRPTADEVRKQEDLEQRVRASKRSWRVRLTILQWLSAIKWFDYNLPGKLEDYSGRTNTKVSLSMVGILQEKDMAQ